jgi:hypothetical protein
MPALLAQVCEPADRRADSRRGVGKGRDCAVNLNPAGSGSGAFWIELYNRGDACEFE